MVTNKNHEIGSHFEFSGSRKIKSKKRDISWLPQDGDYSYTFSGRTAIELAIDDILNSKKIESVYMPSYCCRSMVEPFIKKNIKISYYDVSYDLEKGISYEIDTLKDCDVFFVMSYFGIEDFKLNDIISLFSKRGVKIIEDITHRLLSKESYSNNTDYSISSIRKWLAIPTGGYIVKHNGQLIKKPKISSDMLVSKKIEAMKLKKLYLEGETELKNTYLKMFTEFEEQLKNINSDYKIDSLSLELIKSTDIQKIKDIRRKNGIVLYDGITNINFMEPLIPNPNFEEMCPLFVPVMLNERIRNDLRQFLINNKVYCPVHWPNKSNKRTGIEDNELSLICDQRYSEGDMVHIIELINDWHKGYRK